MNSCVTGLRTIVADLKEFVTIRDMSKLQKYMEDFKSAIAECKGVIPHEEIKLIVSEELGDFQSCIHQVQVLVDDLKELMRDRDMTKLPKYLEDMKATVTECQGAVPHANLMMNFQSVDPLPCLAHLPTLIADVKEFMSTHDTSKLPKYLMDVIATCNDCKALIPHKFHARSERRMLFNKFQSVDPSVCLAHLPTLFADVEEFMSTRDTSKLPKYLMDFMAAYNDCKSCIPHSESIMLNFQSVDPSQCLANFPLLATDVQELLSNPDMSKLSK